MLLNKLQALRAGQPVYGKVLAGDPPPVYQSSSWLYDIIVFCCTSGILMNKQSLCTLGCSKTIKSELARENHEFGRAGSPDCHFLRCGFGGRTQHAFVFSLEMFPWLLNPHSWKILTNKSQLCFVFFTLKAQKQPDEVILETPSAPSPGNGEEAAAAAALIWMWSNSERWGGRIATWAFAGSLSTIDGELQMRLSHWNGKAQPVFVCVVCVRWRVWDGSDP